MSDRAGSATQLRLAELVAALSLATDLGMGQPMEFALRATILAVRLGEALGLPDADLHDTYFVALLRSSGCTAESTFEATLFGDEIAARTWQSTLDVGNPPRPGDNDLSQRRRRLAAASSDTDARTGIRDGTALAGKSNPPTVKLLSNSPPTWTSVRASWGRSARSSSGGIAGDFPITSRAKRLPSRPASSRWRFTRRFFPS